MLNRDDFLGARRRIADVLDPTTPQYSRTFSNYTGHEVWVKPENLQRTGAFKVRGAYNKLSRLCAGGARPGIVTASSGNHAAAVAWAAQPFGIRARVVMPEDAVQSKLDAVATYGAEIILHGKYADERKSHAREIAEADDCVYIDSTDDEDVIEGQGTCAMEILEELPDVEVIVAPVGGGGLMAGVSRAVTVAAPDVKTVAVEPTGSSSMYQSVRAGAPVEVDVQTIADGLRTRKPGELPFSYVSQCVDEYYQVSEACIVDSTLLMLQRMKLLVEPSGAVAMAGVLDGAISGSGRKVAVIATGGNIDLDDLSSLIAGGLQYEWGDSMRPE